MATIPRKFIMTSRAELHNIDPISGQIIGLWDNDEVYYDVPSDGTPDGRPVVRRKISGVRIVTSLPNDPMTDIIYVYIGDHGTLPSGDPLYDLRIWENNSWYIVASNNIDANVQTDTSNDKFYIVGTSKSGDAAVSTLLKNTGVYIELGKINGTLVGTLEGNADTATSATLAQRATNDNASTPKPITGYIHDLSSDATTNFGSTITITKGDGTVSNIRVSDTKYGVFTSSTAGLVSGTNTTVASDNTGLLLSGSGWIDKDDIVMPAADSASKDGLGQNIADTYIKTLSYNTSTELLTVTYGDDDTLTVSIPDTTYSVFTTSANGLVPMASGTGTTGKFLRGDATWQSAITPSDIFAGTTAGLVPSSTSGVNEKFLRSDGSWFGTFDNDEDGLVPKTNTAQATDILHANGTWSAESDTKNTAGSTQITSTQAQSPLYLIGAESQAANPQTYSDVKVYAQGNKLYSNNVEVVNLSDSQALTNKSYNGYTLASACELTAGTSVTNDNTSTPTGAAVITYVSNRINSVQQDIDAKANQTVIAPVYDDTTTYSIDSYVMYDDGDGAKLYQCNTAISTPEAFDPTKWDVKQITDIIGLSTVTAADVTYDNTNSDLSAVNAQAAIDELAENTPLVKTVSGSVCTVTTTSATPLSKCISEVASGSTGINLFVRGTNLFNKNDITANKYIDMNAIIQDTSNGFISNYIPVKPSTVYYETQWFSSDVSRFVAFYKADKTYISLAKPTYSGGTFTTPATAAYARLSAQNTYLNSLMLVEGSTAPSSYVAYSGADYTVSFGETLSGAGTFNFLTGILTRSDSTTAQLTANAVSTLSGLTNIYADTGDTSIAYILRTIPADVSTYDNSVSGLTATNVQSAIDAVAGKWLSGTLTAGATSITLSDASITSTSHIEVFASNGNVNYTSISSTTGSVTITFLAQASDMTVEVRVF